MSSAERPLGWYTWLYEALTQEERLREWAARLPQQIATALTEAKHGRFLAWLELLASLPTLLPSTVDLQNEVRIGAADDISAATQAQLEKQLRQLMPWRKGPFRLFGIHIDTEWRSDWKWDRLKDAIQPLNGRLVLDVGCGNGYYGWRMLGAGARLVVGLDPYWLYVVQHQAVAHFVGKRPLAVLPLGIEALPPNLHAFDTVFSMGVLYHRRDHLAHLQQLRHTLRPGGELVLETLIIDDVEGDVLIPEARYAQMRNVWAIPSVATLRGWLAQSGFSDITLVDVTPTTPAEQRRTDWMTFNSLADFLDPHDSSRTIEGYPAPKRAVLTAVVLES